MLTATSPFNAEDREWPLLKEKTEELAGAILLGDASCDRAGVLFFSPSWKMLLLVLLLKMDSYWLKV